MCVYAELDIADGAQPCPYHCPVCKHPIFAPPRRDTRSELFTSWLQLAQGIAIDVPDKIPNDVFDEYFVEGIEEDVVQNRYNSEEV